MKVSDDFTLPLPLLGGVVQPQMLHLPPEVIERIASWRDACRLAWKLRRVRNMTKRTLAEQAGLYASHVTEYFATHPAGAAPKRELPAKAIARTERVLGNTVMSQWIAAQSDLTVLEGLRAERRRRVA